MTITIQAGTMRVRVTPIETQTTLEHVYHMLQEVTVGAGANELMHIRLLYVVPSARRFHPDRSEYPTFKVVTYFADERTGEMKVGKEEDSESFPSHQYDEAVALYGAKLLIYSQV